MHLSYIEPKIHPIKCTQFTPHKKKKTTDAVIKKKNSAIVKKSRLSNLKQNDVVVVSSVVENSGVIDSISVAVMPSPW